MNSNILCDWNKLIKSVEKKLWLVNSTSTWAVGLGPNANRYGLLIGPSQSVQGEFYLGDSAPTGTAMPIPANWGPIWIDFRMVGGSILRPVWFTSATPIGFNVFEVQWIGDYQKEND